MNEAYIRKSASQAITCANAVLAMPSPFDADTTLALGEYISRSGNAIEKESQVPYPPVEPPWEPPVPLDPEPPAETLPAAIEVPTLPAFTKTIEKNGGSCVVVKGDNQVFRNQRIRYGQWMGYDIPKQDPNNGTVGFMLDECQLETGWAGDYKGWGSRAYDIAQFHLRRVNFLCTNPYGKNIEHGNYFNIYGGGLLEDCFWLNIPGQASQYVWGTRATESANFVGLSGKDVAGDVVRYLNCQVHNCGHFGNGRASFMISMFVGQVGLVLENTLIQKLNEDKVHGALLFEGNARKQSLQLLNSRFYFTGAPDREQSKVFEAKDVLIDGGEYWTAPGNEVKGFRFMDCGPVEIKGNVKGNLSVWVGKNGNWHTKTTLAKVGAGTILQ